MQYRPISVDTFVILGNELHASALWHDITDAAWQGSTALDKPSTWWSEVE